MLHTSWRARCGGSNCTTVHVACQMRRSCLQGWSAVAAPALPFLTRPFQAAASSSSSVSNTEATQELPASAASASAAAVVSPPQPLAAAAAAAAEEVFPEMQLQLPPPANSLIKSAVFIKSSVQVSECPPPRFPEFAVIGRSNVGKSSLINMLTNRKSLAMVSKSPGKTRCINHFKINNSWYLVDLPGYGYARTGKESRKEFEQFTRSYFTQRTTLVMVLLLVDCSIPPQDVDLEYAGWLGQAGLPFSIVFTKADKRKKGQPKHQVNITAFKRALLQQQGFTLLPPSLVTSASAGMGKQELLNYVASLRVMFEQQQKQAKEQQRPGP